MYRLFHCLLFLATATYITRLHPRIRDLRLPGCFGLPGPRLAMVDSGLALRILRNSLRRRLATTSAKTPSMAGILL